MAEVSFSTAGDLHEIVEFIDYVFSKAHRPHDFATLLPKLYGEQGDGACHHILVREQGKLMATVLAYPVAMRIGGERIMTLGVGSVSTHPAARGRGYMKLLMDGIDARAKEIGAAFAVLGGQRQRYQYFGFDNAGYQLRAELEIDNVRHALGNVSAQGIDIVPMAQAHVSQAMALLALQPCFCARSEAAYLDILRSWNNEPFAVMKDGTVVGFGALRKNPDSCHIAELLLEDEDDFPTVMKRLSELHGALTLCAAPWQRRRARWLAAVCEGCCVEANNMFKLYEPERVRAACEKLDGFLPVATALYVAPPDCV